MRKVSLYIAASLDGFIARRDGSLDWLPQDPQEDFGYKNFIAGVDTLVMGRKTYEQVVTLGAWPNSEQRCYVVSRMPGVKRAKHAKFVGGDVVAFVRELRALPGKTIWLVGGGEIVQPCLEAGIVDEIILSIPPVLLGDGVPLFLRRSVSTPLTLRNCHSFPGGLVQLAYDVQAA